MTTTRNLKPSFRVCRCVPLPRASRYDKLSGMAQMTTGGPRGPMPKGGERRVAVQTRLPASVFEDLFDYVQGDLGMARSDFIAYAAITVANELRTEEGLEPVPMPSYLVEAVDGAKNVNPLQEALLEAS